MGAKPLRSFLVLPVRVNLTSMVSPETPMTTPGPKVLWATWSPLAKPSEAAVARGAAAGAATSDALRACGAMGGRPEARREPKVPAVAEAEAERGAPPVERVRWPKTWPP